MTWKHVTGSIVDNTIITDFANLAPKEIPEDLVLSIPNANNESATIGEIFINITGISPTMRPSVWLVPPNESGSPHRITLNATRLQWNG